MAMPICPLTDLPRLICGCRDHAEWAFDDDDLTQAERDYLGSHPLPEADRVTWIVRPIPADYESRPWSEPRDVKIVDSQTLCRVPHCTKPSGDQSFCCTHCLDDLEVALGDVPALMEDLLVTLMRQDRMPPTPNKQRRRSEHTRWDDELNSDVEDQGRLLAAKGYNRTLHNRQAGEVMSTLGNAVTTAVRALAEPLRITLPVMDAAAASRWLLTNLASVALSPAGPDIVADVVREHHRAMRVIDRPEERTYIGLCDKCHTAMHARPYDLTHRCACGEAYDIAERRQDQTDRVLESLFSLAEIADLSTRYLGGRLTIKQLEGWVRRGRLRKAPGSRPHPTKVGEVMALYRAGDVLALASQRISDQRRIQS